MHKVNLNPKFSNKKYYIEVANMHLQNIEQGFLSTLGVDFLELLYESIDTAQNGALYVELIEDNVVGFVAGGRGIQSIYRQMLRRWPRLIWALMPALLSPRKVKRIFEILWFSYQHKTVPECPRAELFSIAVLKSARGTGVANRLFQALAQHFEEDGEPAFFIVVGADLAPAHRFYQRVGAIPIAQISIHQGQSSTLYRYNLNSLA